MKILMVHPHDPFYSGEPWTRRIRAIARQLVKRGHAVKLVYFPFYLERDDTPFSREGIYYIPFPRKISPRQIIKNTKYLYRLVQEAEVVHLQKCHHYAALPVLIACYRTGTPLHYDWDDWEEKIWLEACGRKWHSLFVAVSFSILERALPYLADSVTGASAYLRKLALNRGAASESVKESPVGVDTGLFSDTEDPAIRTTFSLSPQERIVLYVGQLNGSQYVDLFIRAADIVLNTVRPQDRIKFMVVGDGYMKKELLKMVDDGGMTAQFIFTGAVPPEDVPLYIRGADICVAPFKKTKVTTCKSPLKIVEYMACGKYIVASAVPEAVEMLGGCGYLAQEGSYQDLARGIIYFLERIDDEAFGKTIKERLAQRIQYKYTWEYTVENLLTLYRKIAGLNQ